MWTFCGVTISRRESFLYLLFLQLNIELLFGSVELFASSLVVFNIFQEFRKFSISFIEFLGIQFRISFSFLFRQFSRHFCTLVSRNFRLNSPELLAERGAWHCLPCISAVDGGVPTPHTPLYSLGSVPQFTLIIQSAPLQFPCIFPLLHFSSASLSLAFSTACISSVSLSHTLCLFSLCTIFINGA